MTVIPDGKDQSRKSESQKKQKKEKMRTKQVFFFLNLSSPMSGSGNNFISEIFDDEAVNPNLLPEKR